MNRQSEFLDFKKHLKAFIEEAQTFLDKNETKYEKFQLTQVPYGYVCNDKYKLGEKAFEYRENFDTLTKLQKDTLKAMNFALKIPSDDLNIIAFIPFVKYNLNKQKQQQKVVQTVYERKKKTQISSVEGKLNLEIKNDKQEDLNTLVDLFLFSEKTNQKQLERAVKKILKHITAESENNYKIEKNNNQLVLQIRQKHLTKFLIVFPIAINSRKNEFRGITIEKTLCYPLDSNPDSFICCYLKADVFRKLDRITLLHEIEKMGEEKLLDLLQSPIREQKIDIKTSLNLSYGHKKVLINKRSFIPLYVSLSSAEKCDRISSSIKAQWAKPEYETALARRFKATQNVTRVILKKHKMDP